MTGTLTIDNTTADENALVTGAGHDIVLGNGAHVGAAGTGTGDPVNEQTITVSAPDGVADFDANYEIAYLLLNLLRTTVSSELLVLAQPLHLLWNGLLVVVVLVVAGYRWWYRPNLL